MSVSTVKRVFSSDNFLLQAAREKSSPVLYSIKKILHQIITLGFGKGLEQARIERREKEVTELAVDILVNLPGHEELNSQTDIVLHVNDEKGYSVVQKGHLLVLYTDGLFIPEVDLLADLREKSAYTDLIHKLSDVKGTDQWKEHLQGQLSALKRVKYKNQWVVENLDKLAYECIRNNEEGFVNFASLHIERTGNVQETKGRIKGMLDTARFSKPVAQLPEADFKLMKSFFLAMNPEITGKFMSRFHRNQDLLIDLKELPECRFANTVTENLYFIHSYIKEPLVLGSAVFSLAEELTRPNITVRTIKKEIPELSSLHKELEMLDGVKDNLVAPYLQEVLKHQTSKLENEIYETRQKLNEAETDLAQKPFELAEVVRNIDKLNEQIREVKTLLDKNNYTLLHLDKIKVSKKIDKEDLAARKESLTQERAAATEILEGLEADLALEQEDILQLQQMQDSLPDIVDSLKKHLSSLEENKANHLQEEISRIKANSTFIADLKYEQELEIIDKEGRITLEQIHRDIAEGYFENIDELIRDYKANHLHGSEESTKQATFLLNKTVEKALGELAHKAQTFWSKETINSLTGDLLLDEASQTAAITKMGYDLKHTAFKVVMTEADRARRDYKNSLKGKVDDMALRSLKQLPKIINSRDWELLGTTIEIYYKALGDEPVAKVNDLLFHTIEKELKRFVENEQSIVEAFKAYKQSNFPYVLVKKCWLQTTNYIPELVKRLANPDWVIDESMQEYKSELISENNPAINILDNEIPRCIKARDWYGLQKSLIGDYFHNLYNEPARKANRLMLWSIIKLMEKDDELDEGVVKAFTDYTNATHTLSDEDLVDERYDEMAKNVAKIRLVNDLQMSDTAYDLLDEIIEGFYSHDWESLPSLISSYSEEFRPDELKTAAKLLEYKNYIFIFNTPKEEIAPLVKMLDVPNASANAEWMLNEIKEWLKW